MAIVLYDLVGRDDRRFWRTRIALAHKGLEHEARPTWSGRCLDLHDGLGRAAPEPDGRAQGRVRSSRTSPLGSTICTLTGPPGPRAAAQRSSSVLA